LLTTVGYPLFAVEPSGTDGESGRPGYSAQAIPEKEWDVEKTVASYNIEDFTFYTDVEKLSKTPPKYPPGAGLLIGTPWVTCGILSPVDKRVSHTHFCVDIYKSEGLITIVEVVQEENKSTSHLIGWYESKEIWNRLRLEVLRQSNEIRKSKKNMPKDGAAPNRPK